MLDLSRRILNPLDTRANRAMRVFLAISVLVIAGCAQDESSPAPVTGKPIAEYCPSRLASSVTGSTVTVSGRAYYEWRVDGNGKVAKSVYTLTKSAGSASITVNGITFSGHLTVDSLVSAINDNMSVNVTATKTSSTQLTLGSKLEGDSITLANPVNVTSSITGTMNPIRRAEVEVVNSAGAVVQCGETDDSGNFSVALPSNGGPFVLSVNSRANNAYNSAFVMDDETNNGYYKLKSSELTGASSITNLRLIARATGDLLGGAFNILDQIQKSQDYLRAQTANCNQVGASNYYPECVPYTVAPLVYVYWKAGFNPGTYVGLTGGLSYYLNTKRKLYILGGIDGDVSMSDMDHYDNSVIIHEYGHFLEDQFSKPNSPGGSHNGNAIIDPRLAWGEGWANFFQAAVTGVPIYRDTYGVDECTGTLPGSSAPCKGVNFHENIDIDPSNDSGVPCGCNDRPLAAGEGIFREFSVSRLLWDVVKPSSGKKFAEIWAAFNGPSTGMKVVADPFKSISRLHMIQSAGSGNANYTNWQSIRDVEYHVSNLSAYATPITLGACSSTSPMNIRKIASDDGSPSKSDQLRNNDFYYYAHPGGSLNLNLSWTGSGQADLDLFLYREGYVFYSGSTMAGASYATNFSTSGSEAISVGSLPAGNYMINVLADTSSYPTPGSPQTYSTTYTLNLNGSVVCPNP